MSEARAQLLEEIRTFEEEFPLEGEQVEKLESVRNARKSSLV